VSIVRRILAIVLPTPAAIAASISEVLSAAERFAQIAEAEVVTVALGASREGADALAAHASGSIRYVNLPALQTYGQDSALSAVRSVVDVLQPDIVLFQAGTRGHEIAGRLAAQLGAGFASRCVDLTRHDDTYGLVCAAFGGRALATVHIQTKPAIATVLAGAFGSAQQSVGSATVEALELSRQAAVDSGRIRCMGPVAPAGLRADVGHARVVVSGGRGINSREGFDLLAELAAALGGAVGGSRPAADSGWVPAGNKIGQTGRMVAPDVYVAVGI
jgi:electron transfer flavoprotein alpha subunit